MGNQCNCTVRGRSHTGPTAATAGHHTAVHQIASNFSSQFDLGGNNGELEIGVSEVCGACLVTVRFASPEF